MIPSPIMALRQVGADDQVNYWTAFPPSPSNLTANVAPTTNSKVDSIFPFADEAPIKVRKPYTITKQREKWTEEEHQKFLDALKLYGRAWRHIEDHIGTKTAVQIRSHAQKLFSKMGREASLGGSNALAGSGEMEIPPPRPKRKPTHPYPKKASATLSTSPTFEEDNKLPPLVDSAFTPLESSSGAAKASLPSKKTGSSTASLRLFGQTVIQGNDKVEADTELIESTGSPRSQISVGTEETSGISPVGSNPTCNSWNQSSSLLSNLSEPAKVESKSQPLNGFSDWEKCLLAAYGPNMLGGYHLAQPIPAFWQGFVPQLFVPATKDDANTTASVAAATYAIASACQAIRGAFIKNLSNSSNAGIVYNPTAIPAAAENPIPLVVPLSPPNELLPKRGPACWCDEGKMKSASPPIIHEESTAECSSSLTDSSRLSSYESNDEMKPVKKRQRNFLGDAMPVCDSECQRALMLGRKSCLNEDLDNFQKNNANAVYLSSTEGYANGSSDKTNAGQTLSDEVMQPVDSNRQTNASGSEQPVNLIIEACASSSFAETEDFSSKAKGLLKESNWSGKESAASLWACNDVHHKSCVSNECQGSVLNTQKKVVNHTHREFGKHLFAFKVGANSSRYSGVGFVPYRKNP